MSITFDPKKWSSSLRKNKQGNDDAFLKPIKISLTELNFFKSKSGRSSEMLPFADVTPDEAIVLKPPPGGRNMRTIKGSSDDD
ncbi:MAG TPA: hypothetical protein VGB30_04215 [bacterium]|jgi:hypothetical protein